MSPHRQKIEQSGRFSDVILVEGKQTGRTVVRATYADKIASQEVQLTISENLTLMPSFVRSMPCALIKYCSFVLRAKQAQRLPSLMRVVSRFHGDSVCKYSNLVSILTAVLLTITVSA